MVLAKRKGEAVGQFAPRPNPPNGLPPGQVLISFLRKRRKRRERDCRRRLQSLKLRLQWYHPAKTSRQTSFLGAKRAKNLRAEKMSLLVYPTALAANFRLKAQLQRLQSPILRVWHLQSAPVASCCRGTRRRKAAGPQMENPEDLMSNGLRPALLLRSSGTLLTNLPEW